MLFGMVVKMKMMIFLSVVGFVTGVCPSGWIRNENSCYYLSTSLVSWHGAWLMCSINGGHLAEITSSSENDFVYQRAKKHHLVHIWIGSTDEVREGKFIWAWSKTPLSYSRWYSGDPNNASGRENCVYIFINRPGGLWNDAPCSEQNSYVCEKRA